MPNISQASKLLFLLLLLIAGYGVAHAESSDSPFFQIQVIDADSGRGIPMVRLRCTNALAFYTDSQGLAAIQEPGLMNTDVFFHVESHGYRYPEDVFGAQGVVVSVQPGEQYTLEMARENIAERLYRITGQGIYRDSVLLEANTPLEQPVLNGRVMGQDSVHARVYKDQIYWIWGDTSRTDFPLGNFQSTGAVSALPKNGGLPPQTGVNLRYFTGDSGFVRPIAPIVEDQSILVWLDALMTVADAAGQERLVARYEKLRELGDAIEHGLVVFDDERQAFEQSVQFDLEEPWRYPQGLAALLEENGTRYYVFPRPFPGVRVAAKQDALEDPTAYEAFTCLEPGGQMDGSETPVLRDRHGALDWAWRRDTAPVGQAEEQALMELGLMTAEECRFQLKDVQNGDAVTLHRASFHYNAYLDQWIMIGTEIGGRSFLGEVWFASAPSPTGPWSQARRIVTHEDYSFYNPAHHPFFDQENGRIIYFEGTYTKMFSGNEQATPRYDYNQIMYRLDLSDSRLSGAMD